MVNMHHTGQHNENQKEKIAHTMINMMVNTMVNTTKSPSTPPVQETCMACPTRGSHVQGGGAAVCTGTQLDGIEDSSGEGIGCCAVAAVAQECRSVGCVVGCVVGCMIGWVVGCMYRVCREVYKRCIEGISVCACRIVHTLLHAITRPTNLQCTHPT